MKSAIFSGSTGLIGSSFIKFLISKKIKVLCIGRKKMSKKNLKMQFGKFKYNDVKLQKVDFSIKELVKDTGFKPKYTYEEIVNRLYDSLIIKKK